MRQEAEKLIKALTACGANGRYNCNECPYSDSANNSVKSCTAIMHKEAKALIWALFASKDEKRRAKSKAWFDAHKEERAAMAKARYEKLKSAGLCVSCGRKPAENGLAVCAECAEKARANAKAVYERKKQNRG